MPAIRLCLPIIRLWRQCFALFALCVDLVTAYSRLEFQQLQLLTGKLLTAGVVLLDQHLPQSLFKQLYLQLGTLQLVLELFDEFCVPRIRRSKRSEARSRRRSVAHSAYLITETPVEGQVFHLVFMRVFVRCLIPLQQLCDTIASVVSG